MTVVVDSLLRVDKPVVSSGLSDEHKLVRLVVDVRQNKLSACEVWQVRAALPVGTSLSWYAWPGSGVAGRPDLQMGWVLSSSARRGHASWLDIATSVSQRLFEAPVKSWHCRL